MNDKMEDEWMTLCDLADDGLAAWDDIEECKEILHDMENRIATIREMMKQ